MYGGRAYVATLYFAINFAMSLKLRETKSSSSSFFLKATSCMVLIM